MSVAGPLTLLGALLMALAACVAGTGDGVTPPPRTPLPVLSTPTAVETPSEAPETEAPPMPDSESAYQQLLAAIPTDIRPSCERSAYTDDFPAEPGELAGADCDLPPGSGADYVAYKQFEGPATMYGFFDTQLQETTGMGGTVGPGCGEGPGPVEDWDLGRRFCFTVLTDDAQTRWTHDLIYVAAYAFRDDDDFRRLDVFWRAAGPVLP